MTIRPSVNIRKMNEELGHFQACAENAPEGCYVDVKEMAAAIDSALSDLYGALKATGLKVNNCDGFREIEALVYGMLKDINPEKWDMFAVSEGFGKWSSDRKIGSRVIQDAIRNRDFIRSFKEPETK